MIDTATNRAKIDALKLAQASLENRRAAARNEPCAIWRDRPEHWIDEVESVNRAWHDITDQIIALELELEDPIQRAEQRMELEAAIALNGGHDRAEWYMHTPEQERLFQQQIQHDIDYGYYDDDGCWNEGFCGDMPHQCYCGTYLYDDICVDGYFMCESCANEAAAFMYWIGFVTQTEVVNQWDDEYQFKDEE